MKRPSHRRDVGDLVNVTRGRNVTRGIITRLSRRWFWEPTYVVRFMMMVDVFERGDRFPLHLWHVREHEISTREAKPFKEKR